MKAEADRLYQNYVREDIRLSLGEFAVIVVLLVVALRSTMRAARTLAPLVAAVIVVIAGLAVAGFGLLAISNVPMLHTFGLTVGPGAILALLFSAILAPRAEGAR